MAGTTASGSATAFGFDPSLNVPMTGGGSGGISTGAITNGINTITFPANSQTGFWLALAGVAGLIWMIRKKR